MTMPAPSIDHCGTARRHVRQRGDALFEALIGVVLMGIVGLGLTYAAARALNAQRYVSTRTVVVNEIRNTLMSRTDLLQADLCTGAVTTFRDAPFTQQPVKLQSECGLANNISVSGVTLADSLPTSISFTTPEDTAAKASARAWFGSDQAAFGTPSQ